ncbi:hypothetical protein [Mycobacterium deserti]|uniref:Uncharacterized protein n=1 Tax=Mycobacterium deserti TaxID=2978347 RepID=A0ABT2M6D6_9MYCO|nr:hypothetical protein [Mycobacterium deserti]MCT7657823.1 hypothetical protein [Mycobacterium deserti]
MAIEPRHRAYAICSCGWVGQPRLLLSSAKVDALIHAARGRCQPANPLVQPESIDALEPPGMLTVACPGGCGEVLPVSLVITDALSLSADGSERSAAQFTAEAPELHHRIYQHMLHCPSARSWIRGALHRRATSRTG